MKEYHKIQTVYLRDPETKFKTLLIGQYAEPEFAYLANNEWVFTEKVDGTNIRVMVSMAAGPITFGGKTDNASIPAFLVERLQQRFLSQQASLHSIFPDGGCLYGEGYGARIQKGGGNYRPDVDFVLFDVQVGGWWLQRSAVEDVAAKLALDVVPIVGRGTLPEFVEMGRAGFHSTWGAFAAEGLGGASRHGAENPQRPPHRHQDQAAGFRAMTIFSASREDMLDDLSIPARPRLVPHPAPRHPSPEQIERVMALPSFWQGAHNTRKALGEDEGRGCLCLQIEAHLRAGKALCDIPEFTQWRSGPR